MASTESKNTAPKGGLMGWINARFPLDSMLREHVTEYYAPKNFNTWYIFGSLALFVLVIQLVTGRNMSTFYDEQRGTTDEKINEIARKDKEKKAAERLAKKRAA